MLALNPGPSGLCDLLAAPLVAHLPKGATLIAPSVISPIPAPLKITSMGAFMQALPVVSHQLWGFVAPGLYSYEERMVLTLVIQAFAPASITAAPDTEQYFGFALPFFLGFGSSFKVPIAVVVLARIGVVTIEPLRTFCGYFIAAQVISKKSKAPDAEQDTATS